MQCVFISLAFITIPLLHLNKPSRESNFCGKVGDWWIKRVLLALNFLLKNLQRWQVDGWEGKREGKLKGVTSRRVNELMSVRMAGLQAGKETCLPQNNKLFAAVLTTKGHQKGCCFVPHLRVVVALAPPTAHTKGAELPSLETRLQPTI
jgi:hypothetical protein